MEKDNIVPEEKSLINIDGMELSETQLAEQLYNNAGLDPVIDAGLKDYDDCLQREDKFITKVFGPRGNDIKGYGQAVAKRVSVAIFDQLNRQYGGRMGNLKAYINKLEDDKDRANIRYDELMGRVVGILGDEYKELRTDSNQFMDRLTTLMGEDAKASKIDQKALAESLADIDGLRSQIKELGSEKKKLTEDYDAQLARLNAERDEEQKLSQAKIENLEKDVTALKSELEQLKADYGKLKKAAASLPKKISEEEIGKKLGEELYNFLLEDANVPHIVISSVGKFIDFNKYLGTAAAKGAAESKNQAIDTLGQALTE